MHTNSSKPVLEYTPDMYLYQPLPATQPRCMQLGFSGNNQGIIGSLNMQGYTVYIDQDNKQIAFATNAGANTDNTDGVGLGLGVPLLAGLVPSSPPPGPVVGLKWGSKIRLELPVELAALSQYRTPTRTWNSGRSVLSLVSTEQLQTGTHAF